MARKLILDFASKFNRIKFAQDEEKRRSQYLVYGEEALTQYKTNFGGVAQLGEHLPCKQGVRSSILLISTTHSKNAVEKVLVVP